MKYGAIITHSEKLAACLQKALNRPVVFVQPQFLEIYPPPPNQETPVIKIRLPKFQQRLRQLKEPWLYVSLPRFPSSHQALLFGLLQTARHPDQMGHVQIHQVTPDALQELEDRAAPPNPWYVATAILQRLADNFFRQQWYGWFENQQQVMLDWYTLMHLMLWEEVEHCRWSRCLWQENCKAYEINAAGSWIWWNHPPPCRPVQFQVQDVQQPGTFPDRRLSLTYWLLHQPPYQVISQWMYQMETDFWNGKSTYPWIHGIVDFQQDIPEPLHQQALLAQTPKPQPVLKKIRLFQHSRMLFKCTVFHDPSGTPLEQPLPDIQAPLIQKIECLPGQNPWQHYLQALYRWQMNADIRSLHRLLQNKLLEQNETQVRLSNKGREMVQICWKAGMTLARLHDCMKILESVYLDELPYQTAWKQLQTRLQWQIHE